MQTNSTTSGEMALTRLASLSDTRQPHANFDGTVNSPAAQPSSHVSISGRALLRQRLFLDGDSEPPVKTELDSITDSTHYLTEDDRAMLSDLYAEANEQGIDLRNVDMLAFELASYRRMGKYILNANDGGRFDLEGRAQHFQFSDKDAAIAERVLNSTNLSNSRIDREFLNFLMDPGFSYVHMVNFDFLEEVLNKFGPSSSNFGQPFDTKFSTFTPHKFDAIVTTSTEVSLPASQEHAYQLDGGFEMPKLGDKNNWRLLDGKAVQLPVLTEQLSQPAPVKKHTEAHGWNKVFRSVWDFGKYYKP